MDKYQIIWTVLTSVISALAVVAGWVFTAGKKFQLLEDLKSEVKKISSTADKFSSLGDKIAHLEAQSVKVENSVNKMADRLGGLAERVSKIEGKLFGVAISTSPISLTPLGQELVQHSGILDVLKPKKDGLMENIKKQNLKTAYDVQEFVRNIFSVDGLLLEEAELNRLKDYAFSKGVGLTDILYAASIYFRDVALEELKFKVEDLDK